MILSVVIQGNGEVLLGGELRRYFAGRPVEIRFNEPRTAIQIAWMKGEAGNAIVFPESGREVIPSAAELLRQKDVSFQALFIGDDEPENGKWRGARQLN